MAVTVLGRSALVRNMREIGSRKACRAAKGHLLLTNRRPQLPSRRSPARVSPHYLNLDEDCCLQGVAADGNRCRRSPPVRSCGTKLSPGMRPFKPRRSAGSSPRRATRDNLKSDREPSVRTAGNRRSRNPVSLSATRTVTSRGGDRRDAGNRIDTSVSARTL